MDNWFKKLFINEAKPALERHSGGSSGGGEIPDGYILPEGTIEIAKNGLHDVANYKNANVDIPQLNYGTGYVELNENGVHMINASDEGLDSYVEVEVLVNVPIPDGYIQPEGTIKITENGVHNVSNYEKVEVTISGSSGDGENKDMLQSRVDATDSANYLFYQYTGDNLDFISNLDTSKVTNMNQMFSNCRNITNIPNLDTSNAEDMASMFVRCTKLNSITNLNTSKAYSLSSMFSYCESLTTISTIDLNSVTMDSNVSAMFQNCKKLENLTVKNIKVKLQIGSGTSYGHLLTVDSLLNICQECINVNTAKTLTIGSSNLSKLASVYVKLTGEAEEDETLPKLPMTQCESTDEGAMTITDYMALKGWTLA